MVWINKSRLTPRFGLVDPSKPREIFFYLELKLALDSLNPIFAIMAFLSLKLVRYPGLVPHMDDLLWGWCDFPINFSGDLSRKVWNSLLGSGRWGGLKSIMKFPSLEGYMAFWRITTWKVTSSIDQALHKLMTLLQSLTVNFSKKKKMTSIIEHNPKWDRTRCREGQACFVGIHHPLR